MIKAKTGFKVSLIRKKKYMKNVVDNWNYFIIQTK